MNFRSHACSPQHDRFRLGRRDSFTALKSRYQETEDNGSRCCCSGYWLLPFFFFFIYFFLPIYLIPLSVTELHLILVLNVHTVFHWQNEWTEYDIEIGFMFPVQSFPFLEWLENVNFTQGSEQCVQIYSMLEEDLWWRLGAYPSLDVKRSWGPKYFKHLDSAAEYLSQF